jgi:hypothetical protein
MKSLERQRKVEFKAKPGQYLGGKLGTLLQAKLKRSIKRRRMDTLHNRN